MLVKRMLLLCVSANIPSAVSMLQVVETRLFSEGLHVLGQPPTSDKLGQYLEAYFGDSLSPEAVDVVSNSNGESLDAIKAKLQRIYSQVGILTLFWWNSMSFLLCRIGLTCIGHQACELSVNPSMHRAFIAISRS